MLAYTRIEMANRGQSRLVCEAFAANRRFPKALLINNMSG